MFLEVAYATARITFGDLVTISPIWSSLTIKGGVSASVSPATQHQIVVVKALFSPAKRACPAGPRSGPSMPAVRPTVRISSTPGLPQRHHSMNFGRAHGRAEQLSR
jgi:hypothetical protein